MFKIVMTACLLSALAFMPQSALAQNSAADKTAKTCQPKRLKVQMLGTRGPELWDKQASTSYLIWLDGKARLIVDAGSGSSQNFEASGAKFDDIEAVLFSHFHVDHSADFLAYAKGGFFTDRNKDLLVIGPSGGRYFTSASQFVARAIGNDGLYPYLSDFVNPEDQSAYKIIAKTLQWRDDNPKIMTVYQNRKTGLTVKAVATRHGPVPAFAYRVEAAGCAAVFSGDMSGQMDRVPELAKGAEILIAHNAIPQDAVGIAARLHMKPSYIASLAKRAGVKRVLLTHLMRRSFAVKKETLAIIKKSFGGKIVFPNDLESFWVE